MIERVLVLAAAAAVIAISPTEVSAISTHPCLLTTPAGVELAKKRFQQEPWAKKALADAIEQVAALEKDPLPVFEKDWWQEARKKHWTQIYPQIHLHTSSGVAGPMVKAYYAAIAYAVTGDDKYADLVRKVLMHYTDYEFFAKHPDVGLNWSVWCTRALCAYDLIYDTIPEAERAEIDDFFRRAVEAVIEDDKWWIRENPGGLFNNHFAWHKFMIGSYGLFYGRHDLVDYALTSDQGIRDLIEHGIKDDGLWLESSLNYHWTAVAALVAFARQLANANGPIDLWRTRFADGRCLKELFTGPIATLFPDETVPTIGDTYGRRIKLQDMTAYYPAYDAYRLPEIAWVLRNREQIPADALFLENLPPSSSTAPEMTTRLWPEHGYIALRTQQAADYWRGDGYSVFLSYDSDGTHAHRDKFDLMVFSRGAHIAIDPEAVSSAKHAFSAPIQGELNRSTVCHNTVMVDRKDHGGIASKLELVDFVNGDEIKLATVADTKGLVYPGVKMMRTVAATDDYVLDIFQVASDQQHTYTYLFHTCADNGAFTTDLTFENTDLGTEAPWKWLRNAKQASIDTNWQVTARQGDLTTRLLMLAEPGTKLITCDFPKNDRFESPPIPMLLAERRCKSTIFTTILQSACTNLPPINLSLTRSPHSFLRITVDCNGNPRHFTIPALTDH